MKNLIAISICIFITSLSAYSYASDSDATLKIDIEGTKNQNTMMLCVEGVGCVNMVKHNRTYPLTPGDINRIYMVDGANLRSYFQPLPDSCRVTIKENETLVVKGKLMKASNKAYIHGLECSVA